MIRAMWAVYGPRALYQYSAGEAMLFIIGRWFLLSQMPPNARAIY